MIKKSKKGPRGPKKRTPAAAAPQRGPQGHGPGTPQKGTPGAPRLPMAPRGSPGPSQTPQGFFTEIT